MLSPLLQSSTDKRYLIIPVEVGCINIKDIVLNIPLQRPDNSSNDNDNPGSSTTVAIADTQTAMLARQIRDKVIKLIHFPTRAIYTRKQFYFVVY